MTEEVVHSRQPSKLLDSPFNPRQDLSLDREFVASVKSNGVMTPIVCRPVGRQLEIVFGHRRAYAAIELGLKWVPVIVREMSDEEVRVAQLVENAQRTNVPPLDEAAAYERLAEEAGIGPEEIAERVGRSPGHVLKRLQLNGLHPKGREALVAGDLTLSAALVVARLPAELQPEVNEVVRGSEDESCWRAPRIVELVQRSYTNLLKDAQFDTKRELTVVSDGRELPPCSSCPKRTGVQTVLFDDFSDDRCTDKLCWRAKCDVHWAELCESGERECIPDETSLVEIFPNKWSDRPSGNKYLDLDFVCWQVDGKKPLRRALGKKRIPERVFLARDHEAHIHELVLAADVLPQDPGMSDEEKERKKELRRWAKAAKTANALLGEELETRIREVRELGLAFWKGLAHASLAGAGSQALKRAAESRAPDGDPDGGHLEVLESWLVNADSVDCRCLAVELAVAAELERIRIDEEGKQRHSTIIQAMVDELGGDTAAILKRAHDAAFGKADKQDPLPVDQ